MNMVIMKKIDKGYKWLKKGVKSIRSSELYKDTKKGVKYTGKVMSKVGSNLDKNSKPSGKMRKIL